MKLVALPWYHREDWPALHAEFADRESISPCYDAWKTSAMAREAKWRDDGYKVRRVELRPEAFRNCAAPKIAVPITPAAAPMPRSCWPPSGSNAWRKSPEFFGAAAFV